MNAAQSNAFADFCCQRRQVAGLWPNDGLTCRGAYGAASFSSDRTAICDHGDRALALRPSIFRLAAANLRKPPVSAADLCGDGVVRGDVHCLYGYG